MDENVVSFRALSLGINEVQDLIPLNFVQSFVLLHENIHMDVTWIEYQLP